MRKILLQLFIAVLCVQSVWAQALHLSHTTTGHEDHNYVAAADHFNHGHENSSALQTAFNATGDEPSECQQQHHHHASCVALIDSGQSTIQQQSTAQLAGSLSSSHARWAASDIDKPKWPATTF